MTHVMIDLETYGVVPGCPILSIGAVEFDPRSGWMGREYYGVSHADQNSYGLREEPGTVMWWTQQSEEARKVLTDPAAQVLGLTLIDFGLWLKEAPNARVWGNGADFDNPILSVAYAKCGIPLPWKPYNGRCYRTVKNLAPHIKMTKREGTHHNALDDAKSQAQHLMDIVQQTTLTLA